MDIPLDLHHHMTAITPGQITNVMVDTLWMETAEWLVTGNGELFLPVEEEASIFSMNDISNDTNIYHIKLSLQLNQKIVLRH